MSVEIKVENLKKKYGKVVAVEGISFNVLPGELFALLGPSGAGKTTTVNLIAGIIKPDEGEVWIDGFNVTKFKPQQRDCSMVFESYALYPHFTVFENMAFPLKSNVRKAQYTPDMIDKIVQETAKILDIVDLLNRYPKELSGGQKQRVGLGRALVRRPKLFIMDEPIAHLDAKLRHHMRGELKKIQENIGISTILATPDYNEVVAMAHRAAIVSNGKIEQIGTPLDLYMYPVNETVAKSIGDPPINLIKCRVRVENNIMEIYNDVFSIPVNDQIRKRIESSGNQEITLGMRPKDLTVETDIQKASFGAEVYVFEPLGTEAVVSLSLQGNIIKTICPTNYRLRIGDKVGLNFAMEKAYLFDATGGKALPYL